MKQTIKNKNSELCILDKILPVYKSALESIQRYLLLYGGAGSGKSTFAAQKIIQRCINEKAHRILIIRKFRTTIRKSQFQLLLDEIEKLNLTKYFEIKRSFLEIKHKKNGNLILSAGLDDTEKLKSIQGITSIWIEEATELTKEDFLQVDLRLRGETKNYKQIILTFNPTDYNHWLYHRFFTNKCNKSFILKTTYRDNIYLDCEYINILQGLAEQDKEYFKIYAEGEWGKLSNLIFGEIPTIEHLPNNIDNVFYALDFGFNNPTALLKFYEKDKCFYLKEELYERRLTVNDLVEKLKKIITNRNYVIYADPEEPSSIEVLEQNGFNVEKANKEVKAGIDAVKSLINQKRIFSLNKNENLKKELISYKYKTDSNNQLTDMPIKFQDHLMDCLRYGIFTYMKSYSGKADIILINKGRLKK